VRAGLAAALLTALLLPASAAATSTVSYAPGTGLQVTGDDSADTVIVGISGADGQDPVNATPPRVYIVYGGPTAPGPGCAVGTAKPAGMGGQEVSGVKCTLRDPPAAGDANITVSAAGGDDFVGLSNFTFFGVTTLATTDLGAGNDTAIGANTNDLLRGGDGDDSIRAWDGDDRLEGGGGNDTLSPGTGVNVVLGEAGDDQLVPRPAPHGVTTGADDYSGGAGSDLVSYEERTAPVSVLVSGADGQAGENDNIRTDVERVTGGSSADTLELGLATDSLPGSLAGGGGNDTLRSLTKARVAFSGDAGTDAVTGGPGPSQLSMRDGVGEKFSCGDSIDILDADLKDPIPRDCEKVTQGALLEGPNVAIRTTRARPDSRGRVRMTLRCPSTLASMGCAGRLRLDGAASGPAKRYSIRSGRSRSVRVRLSRRDARRVARRSRRMRARSVEAGRLGDKTTIAPVTVLRAR
jgi:Ca2+-binding RTX toxin-like protein